MRSKNHTANLLIPLFTFVIVVILWQYAAHWFRIPDYILPRPSQLFDAYLGMGNEATVNYMITFKEAGLGGLLGSLIGLMIGVALAQNPFFRKMSLPFLIASNAIPVVAIAPVIIIWFGNSLLAKIMVAAFISFFPLALNAFKGLSEYKPHYQQLFASYGASKREFLFKYKFGNALPYLITGLKLNATLSVIGAVVGEFVSSDRGLGFAILQASYNFNTPKLWAYIFLTCSIGILFYLLIYIIENLFLKKYKIK